MMKLTTTNESLADALSMAAACATRRSPNPVVANTMLLATSNRLTVSATDFEKSIQIRLNGDAIRDVAPGSLLLDAQRLQQCVKVLPRGEDLTIRETKEGAALRCGRTEFKVLGQDPSDFPVLPGPPDSALTFLVPARVFAQMLDAVKFAVAPERTRYSLHGVLIDTQRQRLTLVGSDGKRLAMASRDAGADTPDLRQHTIIPRTSLPLITWLCDEAGADEDLLVSIGDNAAWFTTTGGEIHTQLVAGLYPAFRQVLPDLGKHGCLAVVKRERFIEQLRRAEQFTSPDSSSVRFVFDQNAVTMTSRTPDEGNAEVVEDCEYVADELEIGFDPKFLREGLKTATADDVVLQMKDADSALVIESEIGGVSWYYLVMPTELGD